ncbi:MAG: terpene cyclase/mutase family protein [Planctomycetes bacterium]|nr:terpene cyclase/mutase family protein [Planctomycetota bacterium]
MAQQEQNYEEQPADQQYYDQQQAEEMAAGEAQAKELTALATVPWIAIAFAGHMLLIVVAWFMVPVMPPGNKIEVISSQVDTKPFPPEPERKPEEEVEYPKDEPPTEDPTEDPKIVEDAQDDRNEDKTDSPNKSLAENPNNDPSNAESPHPNRGPNSSVGLGGGGGGGGGRGGKGGFENRRARGGGGIKLDRVKAALEWLKDHQNNLGFWSATRFSDDTKRTNARKTYNVEFVNVGQAKGDIGWDQSVDIGLTGMALLAFVGAGFDHKQGEYKEACRRAVMYIRGQQSPDGCYGAKDDEHFMYNHAICAMAMAEAFGLSGDNLLKGPAENAVRFILQAQNPGLGWRYGVRPGVNDSSVTGWMVLALKSCKMAGLEFDTTQCYADAAKWLDSVTAPYSGYPKTGYNEPAGNNARLRAAQDYENNPSMDAINIMSMLFMNQPGKDSKNRDLQAQAKACHEFLPAWEQKKIDYYYWYYASLALFQMGDTYWKKWDDAMSKVLMAHQRGFIEGDKGSNKDTLDEHGSWDSVDAWGTAGGRVYSTAINCLTLEAHYRYMRLGEKKDPH